MPRDLERLTFRRQFIATPDGWRPSITWPLERVTDGLVLARHPDLDFARRSSADSTVVLLGHCVDPSDPLADLETIVDRLASAVSFAELEERASRLSGRWVLLARILGRSRIYHDACALKPVYFTPAELGPPCVASQPVLLELAGRTRRNEQMIAEFESHENDGAWPPCAVPYDGVSQLLPNHYLSLTSGQAYRFWPGEAVEPIDIDSAAREIVALLGGGIRAVVERGPAFMGLSGGYDSRAMLAAAHDLVSRIELYNIVTPSTPDHDREVPRKLARRLGEPLHVQQPVRVDPEIQARLLANVGGLYYDPVLAIVQTLHAVAGDGVVIEGLCAETLRTKHHRQLSNGLPAHGGALAAAAGCAGNPIAARGWERWRETVPEAWVDPRDLMYWETRAGVWGGTGWTLKETLYESFSPYCNRRLLEVGLRVPVEHRVAPYRLFRRIIELSDTRLLRWDFNDERHERLRTLPIPYTLKRVLGWA